MKKNRPFVLLSVLVFLGLGSAVVRPALSQQDRPMSEDPHDQLVLQIRGAVAEYERDQARVESERQEQTRRRSEREDRQRQQQERERFEAK